VSEDQPPPGSPRAAANGDPPEQPPAASSSLALELQQSPSASREDMQTGGHRTSRKRGDVAADSPSSKRQKINNQVDGANPNIRRSNRERRATTKAVEDR
jgi:hypothetical protein